LSARIRENLKEENLEREVPVNLSIGTATWRSGVGTLQALLDEADRAMYADKVRCRQVNKSVGRSA
jgi:GGDEF domain-containing protein